MAVSFILAADAASLRAPAPRAQWYRGRTRVQGTSRNRVLRHLSGQRQEVRAHRRVGLAPSAAARRYSLARRPTVYDLRAPAAPLRPFIEHYWAVTPGDGAQVDLCVEVFVDARADLVFNFGAPYTREVLGGATRQIRRSNLDAQRLRPIRITQRGDVRICGVRFRLGGLAPFARGPLAAFTDATPAPSTVLGHGARALEASLRGARDLDAQARLLDAFFTKARVDDDARRRFQVALAALTTSAGRVTVAGMAETAEVSPRQLDRLFARHLGISPKVVARVLRFQSALRALMRDPGCSLAEVAAAWGYFDQAHFVRDFKRFSGGVPRGYRGYFPTESPGDFAPNVVRFVQDPGREGA